MMVALVPRTIRIASSIHTRSHEIGHRGIDSYEVNMFACNVENTRDKCSSRPRDITTIFHEYFWHSHITITKHVVIFSTNSLCKFIKIYFMICWTVRDTDSSTEIDEFKCYPCLFIDLTSESKKYSSILYKLLFIPFIGNEHGMKPESFDAFSFEVTICIDNLIFSHTVFGFDRIADDARAFLIFSRIITTTDDIRESDTFQSINM